MSCHSARGFAFVHGRGEEGVERHHKHAATDGNTQQGNQHLHGTPMRAKGGKVVVGKRVVWGRSGTVRIDVGGGVFFKKKIETTITQHRYCSPDIRMTILI